MIQIPRWWQDNAAEALAEAKVLHPEDSAKAVADYLSACTHKSVSDSRGIRHGVSHAT